VYHFLTSSQTHQHKVISDLIWHIYMFLGRFSFLLGVLCAVGYLPEITCFSAVWSLMMLNIVWVGVGKRKRQTICFFIILFVVIYNISFVIGWGFLLLTPSGSRIIFFGLLSWQVVRKCNTLLLTYFGSCVFGLFRMKWMIEFFIIRKIQSLSFSTK